MLPNHKVKRKCIKNAFPSFVTQMKALAPINGGLKHFDHPCARKILLCFLGFEFFSLSNYVRICFEIKVVSVMYIHFVKLSQDNLKMMRFVGFKVVT
jgi:hypothetical protein